MSYESNTGLGVSNHYGEMKVFSKAAGNGGNDVARSSSFVVEDGLTQVGVVPVGALITAVYNTGAGAVGQVSVGGTNVGGATEFDAGGYFELAAPVEVTTKGEVTAAGGVDAGGKLTLIYTTLGDL